jgi:uncharacterized protein (TIGR03083 family)
MTAGDRLDVLGSLWAAWAAHGRAMADTQWRLPTRLGDWDVRSLFAHAAWWPAGFGFVVGQVRDAELTHRTAADLLREFNAPDGVADRGRDHVAAKARADAAKYRTGEMVGQFAEAGPLKIATARELGPVVVDYFGMARMRLDEVVSIGIVEATVHLLDLQRAVGMAPDVPVEGLAHTAAVLAQMAPPVDLIEAATGRATPDLFPVLS